VETNETLLYVDVVRRSECQRSTASRGRLQMKPKYESVEFRIIARSGRCPVDLSNPLRRKGIPATGQSSRLRHLSGRVPVLFDQFVIDRVSIYATESGDEQFHGATAMPGISADHNVLADDLGESLDLGWSWFVQS